MITYAKRFDANLSSATAWESSGNRGALFFKPVAFKDAIQSKLPPQTDQTPVMPSPYIVEKSDAVPALEISSPVVNKYLSS